MEFSLEMGALERLAPLWAALDWQAPFTPRGSLTAKGRLGGPWASPSLSLTAQAGELTLPQVFVRRLELDLETPRLGLPLKGRLRLGAQELAGASPGTRPPWRPRPGPRGHGLACRPRAPSWGSASRPAAAGRPSCRCG